ncbi:phosphatase PAP2 family protein [Sphingobium sp. AN558]|uniref:phosphatase PAP2 family protein n=1 Tax=Sphingobium sp. AN558 TaxID=3133442 RepID=UPI0030BAA138
MPAIFDRLFRGHRTDSRILIFFLATAASAFLSLRLGSEIMEGESFAIDRVVLEGLRTSADRAIPIGPYWVEQAMRDITALGGVTILTLLTALTAAYLLASRKAGTALFLIAAIAGGAIVSSILKAGYARPRPELVPHLVEVHSTSFPSGHAMNSAITYLTLGVLLARSETDRRVRIFLMSVAIGLTLTIGMSRVYLGVHWPSDVVAGWCVGACWAALCSLAARALQRSRTIEQPTEKH